jgi:hypothetical protein
MFVLIITEQRFQGLLPLIILVLAIKARNKRKLYAALGMFYSIHSGSKYHWNKSLLVYTFPVSPEAL